MFLGRDGESPGACFNLEIWNQEEWPASLAAVSVVRMTSNGPDHRGWRYLWCKVLSRTRSLDMSVQFSSVAQSSLTLCDSMICSIPRLPVHHQCPEFTQTHVHRVSDAIQPSQPLLSPSPPAPNPSQHQRIFQWVNTSHEVAKVLEFQL